MPRSNETVRFLTDFREENERIVRKPFTLPQISDVIQKLEGFQCAAVLDLNMGCYHNMPDAYAQRIFVIALPWEKYKYLRLLIGLSESPDKFQDD